jgi:hypothetical protein
VPQSSRRAANGAVPSTVIPATPGFFMIVLLQIQ